MYWPWKIALPVVDLDYYFVAAKSQFVMLCSHCNCKMVLAAICMSLHLHVFGKLEFMLCEDWRPCAVLNGSDGCGWQQPLYWRTNGPSWLAWSEGWWSSGAQSWSSELGELLQWWRHHRCRRSCIIMFSTLLISCMMFFGYFVVRHTTVIQKSIFS